ncbi:MAG TPA: PAS and helix-turn-helix domain-containing protein [Solirubrobacteraceae bacterium]|jgi:PAS domain S-box-containing protein|nr:PAS and helix-turn-helix domain-containing protein [Solirubrobacteraceae bacterium]
MPHANPEPAHPNGPPRSAFWTVFAESRIPMALVDRDRRYVHVNDAVLRLYQYPLEEVLGSRAGRTVVDEDHSVSDADWNQLLRTSELYGERVITHGNGSRMHVSYAAHATTVGGTWLALFVTLSARFLGGSELIGRPEMRLADGDVSRLTVREREVVRLVALGNNTRRIAAELSLSQATVRSHVGNAMGKTGARTRAHLVALVLADGLVQD